MDKYHGASREELLKRIKELESLVMDLEWALENNDKAYRLLLGRTRRQDEVAQENPEAKETHHRLTGTSHVLVVDDDEDVRRVAVESLSVAGFVVSEATDGAQALHMITKGDFDVVILDIHPGATDGFSLLKQIRLFDETVCVILMTRQATVESAVEALRQGAYDYLHKPFTVDQLRLAVNRAMERRYLLLQAREKEAYRQLSITDGLTGLYNHRFFIEVLEQELLRAQRYPKPVSLLMIDLDNFKAYNDTNGHQAGDKALRTMARVFLSAVRRVDVVARYGGEEFAIVLPETDREGARSIARHIRQLAARTHFEGQESIPGGNLTVSVGVGCYPDDAATRDLLIGAADGALYEAKRFGRDRVCYLQDGRSLCVR